MFFNQMQVVEQGVAEEHRAEGCVDINSESLDTFSLGDVEYKRIKPLGEGGFAKIHLIEQMSGIETGETYAMKVINKRLLSPGNRRRTETECQILKECRHPFVLQMWQDFNLPDAYVFVLQHYEGGDLFARHDKLGKFGHDEAVFYLGEITLGLEYLHHRGIIHRDLKMENILISCDGHITIADFGLSAILMPGEEECEFDVQCGTEEFMAPEIVELREYTRAVDVWAFGVMAFEMLTGELPFKGSTTYFLESEILYKEPEFPCGVRKNAWDLILKTLDKDPRKRPWFVNGNSRIGKIRYDPFFASFDFLKAEKLKLRPPYIPLEYGT